MAPETDPRLARIIDARHTERIIALLAGGLIAILIAVAAISLVVVVRQATTIDRLGHVTACQARQDEAFNQALVESLGYAPGTPERAAFADRALKVLKRKAC